MSVIPLLSVFFFFLKEKALKKREKEKILNIFSSEEWSDLFAMSGGVLNLLLKAHGGFVEGQGFPNLVNTSLYIFVRKV